MIAGRGAGSKTLLTALVGVCFACSSPDHPPSSGLGSHDAGSADTGFEASAETGAHDGGSQEGGHQDGGPDAQPDGMVDAVAPVDAGDSGSGDGGFPPPPVAVCNPGASWGTGVLLSISTALDDELDAVTPDELSIAWTLGTGNAATIDYSDRASSTVAFGTPQTVAAGSFATDRVALSPDGLRLVVVNADGLGFSELTRSSRMPPGNTFGPAAPGSYTNLDAAGALATGQSYGDPVLSADDRAFYYSIYGGGVTTTIFRASRLFAGDPWPDGAAVAASSGLAAQGSLRRRPTAISSDGQTLFFWDQVMGTERAAWINESTGAFDMFVDLGARALAVPDTSCKRLYYSAQGAASVDLFVATD